MPDDFDHIGEYLTRYRSTDPEQERPLTKSHRIETRVADRFGTHCGRQLASKDGTVLVFAPVPVDRCQRC